MLKIEITTFENDYCDSHYPCLLEHIESDDEKKDIILAVRYSGDFIDAIVLQADRKLNGFTIGSYHQHEFLKRDYRYFYGKLILSN